MSPPPRRSMTSTLDIIPRSRPDGRADARGLGTVCRAASSVWNVVVRGALSPAMCGMAQPA